MKILSIRSLIMVMGIFMMFSLGGCTSDGKKGESSLDSLLVTVPDDISPVANAGADQTVIKGTTVVLDGSASSDEDGEIVSYVWQLLDGTAVGEGITLTVSTASYPVGSYEVVLIVTDNQGATGVDTVVITVVNPDVKPKPTPPPVDPTPPPVDPTPPPVDPTPPPENQPPVADAGDDLAEGICAAIVMDGTGSSDPDGNIDTYVWTTSGGDVIGNGATATLAMAGRTPGEHTITLTVTDDQGATDTDIVLVTVNGTDGDYDFSYIVKNPNGIAPHFESITNAHIYTETDVVAYKSLSGGTTFENTSPGIISLQFVFPGNIELAWLYTRIDSYHWSYGRGHTFLHGSANGMDWEQLAEATPPVLGGWTGANHNGFVPDSMIGGTDIWVKAELYTYDPDGAPSGFLTNTAQFMRHSPSNNNTTFKLNVCHEGVNLDIN